MNDARRRRWVAHDVHFYDAPLGGAILERFGTAGIAVWFGFIAACKKNHIEGEVSFASDQEALNVFGLPGVRLVDNEGRPWSMRDFFRLTGRHKVTRTRRRGHVTHIACTRWAQWQHARNTRPPDGQNRRSDPKNRARLQTESDRDVPADTDSDTDSNTPLPPAERGDNILRLPRPNSRSAGTNPRAVKARQRQTDATVSFGQMLAANRFSRDEAVDAIAVEFTDPDLRQLAVETFDRTVGDAS
jgi:hypothetical protein